MHSQSKTWSHCLSELETELSEQQFNIWIKPLQAIENASTLRILAPNHFVVDWLNQHYIKKIIELAQTTKKEVKVVIEVGSIGGEQPKINKVTASNPPPPPLDNRLNPIFSFENFVEGKSNQLAKAAATQIAKNPGKSYNPLFIYGGVGLGKTHIMQAIGNKMVQENLSARVSYVHSERFVGDMVKGLQHNTISEFKRAYRSLDALLIDDIQFFSGKPGTQDVFFHIFNHLHQNGRQVILTSDKAPVDMQDIELRLLSRFKWGLSAELQHPDFETRISILENKLYRDGIEMNDEVIEYVAKNIKSNVRELEGAIISLIAQASFNKKEITIELAKEIIEKFVKNTKREVSIDYIQKIVSDYFQMDIETLQSKTRKRHIVQARQLAMFFAKKFTKASLASIGSQIGKRDHATVLHACKTVDNLSSTDKQFRKFVEDLGKKLSV